ncbi:MAG: hypothetical protein WCX17_03405 [Parcubacteria group bacterium]|jgi:hypothetical protein
MKNKNLIIIIIVVVVIIVLAVVFFLTRGKQAAQNPTGSQSATMQTSGIKDSLLGILQSATGVKCSVTDANGTYTVIAKGDKVKVEGINSINPQTQKEEKGTMINDGTWAYIWTGKQGMKFNLKDTQQGTANPEGESTDWKNWAQQMQNSGAKYDCNPTVATDADFTPPSNVTFQDLGELMKNLPQMQNIPDVPAMPNQ